MVCITGGGVGVGIAVMSLFCGMACFVTEGVGVADLLSAVRVLEGVREVMNSAKLANISKNNKEYNNRFSHIKTVGKDLIKLTFLCLLLSIFMY